MELSHLRSRLAAILFLSEAAAALNSVPVLQPTILDEKSYIEIFTVTAQHDDHTFIQMQLSVTNLGIGNKNATGKILVLHAAEKPWKGSTYYDQKNWAYSDTPNPTLSVGPCSIVQKPEEIDCSGAIDGISVHIVLEGMPRPTPVPHTDFGPSHGIRSTVKPSSSVYEYEVILPWTKAKTTLTLPGHAQSTLEGCGMLEHSRSIGNPRDISQGWVTFRGGEADRYFLANFRTPPAKGSAAVGWIWREGATAPKAMEGLYVTTATDATSGSAREIHVITAADSSFRITGGELLCRYSFIDELGPVLGYLVQMVVCNPVTRYYTAEVQFSSDAPPVQGILELMTIE